MPTGKLTEADVTSQIKGYLEARGWYAIRLQSGTVRGVTRGTFMRVGKPGLPDWVFVRKWGGYPIHLFCEMKKPGKKLAPDQVAWFKDAEYRGLWTIWADSLEMFVEKYEEGMLK
mgnify:CR=1 FL=1